MTGAAPAVHSHLHAPYGGVAEYTSCMMLACMQPPAPLPAAAPASASWPHVLEQLRLGPGAGRAYGALCGDLNPIHVHALTARLFGFKRPIAHALYITAMAEAALRRAGGEHRGGVMINGDDHTLDDQW